MQLGKPRQSVKRTDQVNLKKNIKQVHIKYLPGYSECLNADLKDFDQTIRELTAHIQQSRQQKTPTEKRKLYSDSDESTIFDEIEV
ncbi:hypothetical protein SS50377_23939 [Spironucleus salmonicida]|uniref:Uncharacterized protein n=1 Tax=Spironucleus salmonicida TaxID=348837 RepID=V6LUM8_9EUKA|nr:hypothetical protein SS50377_23939 [Spironucleus salmonicida]|eukprot:EST48332.1 Hypothetical protein SS50377_11536 [Spironucleus salmonicida]